MSLPSLADIGATNIVVPFVTDDPVYLATTGLYIHVAGQLPRLAHLARRPVSTKRADNFSVARQGRR